MLNYVSQLMASTLSMQAVFINRQEIPPVTLAALWRRNNSPTSPGLDRHFLFCCCFFLSLFCWSLTIHGAAIVKSEAIVHHTNIDPLIPYISFDKVQGPAAFTVNKALIDGAQRLWLATSHGVYWYDGSNLISLTSQLALPRMKNTENITVLYRDSQYMFFNWSNHLVRFDSTSKELRYASSSGWLLKPDVSATSVVWCQSNNNIFQIEPNWPNLMRVFSFNLVNGEKNIVFRLSLGLQKKRINPVCSDSRIILDSTEGLVELNVDLQSKRPLNWDAEEHQHAGAAVIAKNKWFYYVSDERFHVADLQAGKVIFYDITEKLNDTGHGLPTAFFLGRDDSIYVAYDDGAVGTFDTLSQELSEPVDVSQYTVPEIAAIGPTRLVTPLLIGKNNWFLMAHDNRITMLSNDVDSGARSFIVREPDSGSKPSFDFDTSANFCKNADGFLWHMDKRHRIGVVVNGGHKSDAVRRNRFLSIGNTDDRLLVMDRAYEWAFACDMKDSLFAAHGGRLFQLYYINGSIRANEVPVPGAYGKQINGVLYVGEKWLIMHAAGRLFWLDRKSGKIAHSVVVPDHLVRNHQIYLVTEDGLSLILVSNKDHQLLFFNVGAESVVRINLLSQLVNDAVVSSMIARSNHEIWLNMSDGGLVSLSKIDTGLTSFKNNYVLTPVISGDKINKYYCGLYDGYGNLYQAGNHGIDVVNIQRGARYKLGPANAAVFSDYSEHGCFAATNGVLYFAANAGWTELQSKLLNSDRSLLPPVLLAFQGENKSTQPLFEKRSVSFDWFDGEWALVFSSAAIGRNQALSYRSFLDGYEKKWSAAQQSNVFYYRNVPAGKYKMFVQSTLDGYSWSGKSSVTINILLPWYRTEMAYIAYGFVATLMLLGAVLWTLSRFLADRGKAVVLELPNDSARRHLNLALWATEDGLWDLDFITNKIYRSAIPWLRINAQEIDIADDLFLKRIHEEDLGCYLDARERCKVGLQKIFELQYRVMDDEGKWVWVYDRGRLYVDQTEHSREYRLIGMTRDISAQKHTEHELRRMVYIDPLTGLANRKAYTERLNTAIESADSRANGVALFFIDLDRFKNINDTMGHRIGDVVLQQISDRMQNQIMPFTGVDLARVGGDEFTLVVRDAQAERIKSIAESLLLIGSQPVMIDNAEMFVSLSIGVAIYPQHGQGSGELMRNADAAMYDAKKSGRNAWHIFDSLSSQSMFERMHMELALRRAADRNQFHVMYQPKVDLHTGRCVGIEVLLRWHDDKWIKVNTGAVIELLETTGLIHNVGSWVLSSATAEYASLPLEYRQKLRLAINVSAVQVSKGYLRHLRSEFITSTDFSFQQLEIELTESVFVSGDVCLLQDLIDLRNAGVRVVIDDFGKGCSSFRYLRDLPIDGIKMDSSFIERVDSDEKSANICQAVIDLAHSLKLTVTAEGVERHSQGCLLTEMGCDQLQGFYYAKPMAMGDLSAWLPLYGDQASTFKPLG